MIENVEKKLLEIKKEVIPLIEEKLEKSSSMLNGEYLYRCPFCGDSQKNPYKGHFKINDDLTFHCFRCWEHGSLNFLFKELGIDYKIPVQISYRKLKQGISLFKKKNNNYHYYNKFDKQKVLEYLYNRIGLVKSDKTYKLIKNYLIIHPLNFLNSTNFQTYKSLREKIKNNHYFGFLSYGGYKLFLRKLKDSNNINTPNKLIVSDYRYKNNLDFFLFLTKPIKEIYTKENQNIVIGEGVFDIIGFSKILETKNKLDNYDIFIASGGKGLLVKTIEFLFLRLISKLNITWLIDKDLIPYASFYRKKMSVFSNKINIIYNEKSKDFGDIQTTGYKIKKLI